MVTDPDHRNMLFYVKIMFHGMKQWINVADELSTLFG